MYNYIHHLHICVVTYTHRYVHTCIHARINTYIHTYVCMHTRTNVRVYMYRCMCACMHVHMYTCKVCMNLCMYVCTVCKYIHTSTRPDLAAQPVRFWLYQLWVVVLKKPGKNEDTKICYTLNCVWKYKASCMTGTLSSHFDLPHVQFIKEHITRRGWSTDGFN